MIILGIDTSCDDTSMAVLRDGRDLLANIVSSQADLHALFGGIVPEIASRKHIEFIDGIYSEVMHTAGITLDDVDAVSVTAGPGLIGSVLVGLAFAKGLCLSGGKPLVGVNHIRAHALSILLERDVPFPYVALVVSGGHTIILEMHDPHSHSVLGTTRDDAAGEALDKIAKFLGIGYPGGKVIEELAKRGREDRVQFPRPMMDGQHFDFSFSGLKTAFVNYVKKNGITAETMPDLLASFQEAIFDVLAAKTVKAAQSAGAVRVVVGGGVAANGRLREVMRERCGLAGMEVHFSSPGFCTDNGAMVALSGGFSFERGLFSGLDLKGYSRMKLSR